MTITEVMDDRLAHLMGMPVVQPNIPSVPVHEGSIPESMAMEPPMPSTPVLVPVGTPAAAEPPAAAAVVVHPRDLPENAALLAFADVVSASINRRRQAEGPEYLGPSFDTVADFWNNLGGFLRTYRLARERRNPRAPLSEIETAREQFQTQLQALNSLLTPIVPVLASDTETTAARIFDDLLALRHEFPEIEVRGVRGTCAIPSGDQLSWLNQSDEDEQDQRQRPLTRNTSNPSLVLWTHPITLYCPDNDEDVDMGVYGIVIDAQGNVRLWNKRAKVMHPHGSEGASELCMGDTGGTIHRLLERGQIFDAALMIYQIVKNYSPDAAFRRLSGDSSEDHDDDSDERECRDCGSYSEDYAYCNAPGCGRVSCSDCANTCDSCTNQVCARHIRRCEDPDCEVSDDGGRASYCPQCVVASFRIAPSSTAAGWTGPPALVLHGGLMRCQTCRARYDTVHPAQPVQPTQETNVPTTAQPVQPAATVAEQPGTFVPFGSTRPVDARLAGRYPELEEEFRNTLGQAWVISTDPANPGPAGAADAGSPPIVVPPPGGHGNDGIPQLVVDPTAQSSGPSGLNWHDPFTRVGTITGRIERPAPEPEPQPTATSAPVFVNFGNIFSQPESRPVRRRRPGGTSGSNRRRRARI